MLMKPSTALLDSLLEQSVKLRAEILSHIHELPEGKPAYYISPSGNDANDGRSPTSAWKTLDALREHLPEPGSEVLFECGGIWRGSLRGEPGVTYSSYGFGEKPRIYGSPLDGARTGHWREIAPDIWRYSRRLSEDCGGIVFDGGANHAVKLIQNFENGEPVEQVSHKPFGGWRELCEDLTFFHDLGRESVANEAGGHVYLYSKEGNPAERFSEIEFLTRHNIMRIAGDGVTVDNLCLMYGGCHGIGSGTVKELTVTNCVIGWIGGSLQFYKNGRPTRFGNGIEVYGGCDGYKIDHCLIYQVYDAGITHQLSTGGEGNCLMNRVSYTNNLIEYCTYSIEYFLGASTDPCAKRLMRDIEMRGNILRYAGFGWGDQRWNKDAAAHIKGWDSENHAENFVIEDNLMVASRYMLLHCGAADANQCPSLRGNCFLQYADGQLGRFGRNPTELMRYLSENILREELVGNEFYLIEDY